MRKQAVTDDSIMRALQPYALETWCTNLAITPEEMPHVRLGKRLDGDDLFRADV